MPRTALVLDGNSGPALATTRSLGRAGWRVVVPTGTRSARSRYAAVTRALPEAHIAVDPFLDAVAAAAAAERPDVLVPCTDASAELLWQHEEVLHGAGVLGGDRRSFEVASDKARALALADELGFGTPDWLAPSTVAEAIDALPRLGTPCVVKPRRSYRREDGRLVQRRHQFARTPEELKEALRTAAEPDGTLPVIQQYVAGRSLSVSAVIDDGEILVWAARETLSFVPVAGGYSVWKRTIEPNDVGVRAALQLLVASSYCGLAEVEYQVPPEGRERLMEIGARAHGWIPLAVAAGADLPLVAARAAAGEEQSPYPPYRVGVEMRWPAGELARIRTALSPSAELPPEVRRRDVLAKAWPPWRPGMQYDGLSIRDPGPWLPSRLQNHYGRARPHRAAR